MNFIDTGAPELFSDEYYAEFYPKCKAVGSKRNHVNLWKSARASSGVTAFLDCVDTTTKLTRSNFLMPLKDHYIYFTDDEWTLINKVFDESVVEKALGESTYVKDIDYDKEFNRLDLLMIDTRSGNTETEITNLWGLMLPPRRQDVYNLEIRKNYTDECINFYNQKDKTFYFHSDKNKKKVKQSFSLLKLAPLYKNFPNLYKKIFAFLQSRPEGKLANVTNIARSIQGWYGVSNTTLRKYWQSTASEWFDMTQRKILNEWMDHTPSTIIRSYKK